MCSKAKDSDSKAKTITRMKKYDDYVLNFRETINILNEEGETALITQDNKKCAHLIDSLSKIYICLVEAFSSSKGSKETNMGIEETKQGLSEIKPTYIIKNLKEYYKYAMTKTSVKKDGKHSKTKKDKKGKKSKD